VGKKNATFNENVDTVLGSKSSLEGNIDCEGSIRIDGKIKGDIRVDGDVFVGSGGLVVGNIVASNVHLSGTVEGNIHCNGILKILSSARMFGDIEVGSFVADEGSVFHGRCSMIDTDSSGSAGKKRLLSNKDYKKSGALDQVIEEEGK
jgi:cytoskeletal protein CcmA (bactofilin family)